MPSNHICSCNCQRNAVVHTVDGLSKLELVVLLPSLKSTDNCTVSSYQFGILRKVPALSSFSFFAHEQSLSKQISNRVQ